MDTYSLNFPQLYVLFQIQILYSHYHKELHQKNQDYTRNEE
jgi:hypothetical protein